ncbi:MAG: hypothetical protein R2713_03295 [Ilumatobacteraceae bacterium]
MLGAAIVLVAIARRGMRLDPCRDRRCGAVRGGDVGDEPVLLLAIDRIDLGKSVVIEFLRPDRRGGCVHPPPEHDRPVLAVAGVLVLGGVELDSEPLGLVFILAASTMWARTSWSVAAPRADRGLSGLALGLAMRRRAGPDRCTRQRAAGPRRPGWWPGSASACSRTPSATASTST